MKITEMNLKDIHPYENNPRINDNAVEKVANSIKEFGFTNPIAIDKDNIIINGHTRYRAAKLLGLDVVPTIKLDNLSEDKIKALRIADNSTAELAEWDFNKLMEEIDSIEDDFFDFEDFGLDDDFFAQFDSIDNKDEETPAEKMENELYDQYSDNIGKVIYEPKETSWSIKDLFDPCDKFDVDIEAIKDENLRELLKIRQAWFCDFNFSRIADYYAYQATPEEQRIFEKMGLVLLDRDQLIENGFAKIVGDI